PAFHYSLQPECSTRRVKAQFARDPTGRLAADWPEDRRPLRGRGVVYTAVFLTSWPYCRYRSAVARVAGPWGGPGGRQDEGAGGERVPQRFLPRAPIRRVAGAAPPRDLLSRCLG